jgi:hypothetical protein
MKLSIALSAILIAGFVAAKGQCRGVLPIRCISRRVRRKAGRRTVRPRQVARAVVTTGFGAPGVGVRRGTPMNRGGPVNRVGRR